MIYREPQLDRDEERVLELIDELRELLRNRVAEPKRWIGSLRRVTIARAVQGSNTIEGYNATLDDVVAAVDGDELLDADTETRLVVEGYRDAMTYVLQLAQDEHVSIDEATLKALHFMMLRHDLSKYPGRWRPGPIFVRREPDGEPVYEGPEADLVEGLIGEMLAELDASTGPVLVRAAMAHLNLVMIHPFKDGNGRMARCLQTLVLAREKIFAPVFSSIEEYLGRNTQSYYDMLAAVGEGSWHPEHSPKVWVRYCMTAHYRQARTMLRRFHEYERLWVECSALAREHRLPERAIGGMMDAAIGLRVRNASYRATLEATAAEAVADLTATRDLKALVAAGIVDPVGERRGRYYVASDLLRGRWTMIRNDRLPRDESDPFELVRMSDELDAAALARQIAGHVGD